MTATVTEIDFRLLVEALEPPQCESEGHGVEDPTAHDDGPATHYVRLNCPHCTLNLVKTYCAAMVRFVSEERTYLKCSNCAMVRLSSQVAKVLGPV